MSKSSFLVRFALTLGWASSLLFGTPASAFAEGRLAAKNQSEAASPQDSLTLYDTGNPSLRDVWVDPVNGNDANDGTSPATAFRTLTAAWNNIPINVTLTQGVRINLQPGTYPEAAIPVYWESRHGTFAAPIWMRGNGSTRGQVVLQGNLNIYDTYYIYFEKLSVSVSGDVFHCELCNHVLLRNVMFNGGGAAQETIKVNQSQYLYVENSDLSGAYENVIDYVAVQYGHIVKNKIHGGGDWCAYVKGGSAYIRVEANLIYNCGTGGFTAGQGTGFEYMVSPWLHYETYDVKFVNNIIHDTEGACFGVNGGYDILMAYNTCYRVGQRSHVIEVVFGLRTCDGDTARCGANRSAGGWGTNLIGNEQPIPDRNVYIYNNIVYNPPGYQSQWQHFAIYGPRYPASGSNIPSPARTDVNLKIRGNLIWNGPAGLPLGIEDSSQGCRPTNATCNESQLRADNAINVIQPELVNPGGGDFHPVEGGNVFTATTYAIPNFSWSDAPTTPPVPAGTLSNLVNVDYAGTTRASVNPPGAYFTGAAIPPPALLVRSQAANDGWILESTETSNQGGTMNSTATTFNLGDDATDRQYRALLSFDTSALPDNAVITKVTLKIKYQGVTGTNPFATHGILYTDVRNGVFGGNATLQLGDFQAVASKTAVGTIPNTPSGGWYSKIWTSGIFPYINKVGATQIRLRFQTDDNDDLGADFLRFYSGNASAVSDRPLLIVEYYVP